MKDARSERTEEKIRQAFLGLMREKPFESIKVVEVADLAGISRKTFYGHYDDINNLAVDCFRAYLSKTCEEVGSFRIAQCETPQDLVDYVVNGHRDILTFCRDNVEFARLVYEKSPFSRYLSSIPNEGIEVMTNSVNDIQPNKSKVRELLLPDSELVSKIYFSMQGLVLGDWIDSGMEEDIEVVARRMTYLTFHLSDVYSASTGACAELKRITLDF